MIEQVSPCDLASWGAAASGSGEPLLLDVREPAECRMASVAPQGFQLRQWPMHTIPARLAELDRTQPVAVLCHHGGRSMQVALLLEQWGFACLANVRGGIDGWSRQFDPNIPRY